MRDSLSRGMTGLGQSLQFRDVRVTSAFPLIATKSQTRRHVVLKCAPTTPESLCGSVISKDGHLTMRRTSLRLRCSAHFLLVAISRADRQRRVVAIARLPVMGVGAHHLSRKL